MNITKKLLEGKSKELTTHEDITIIGNLMWEKESRKMADWYETEKAMNYAKHLRLCGYDDWRLPTIDELVEIVTLCGGVITNEYTDCVDNKNDINISNEIYQAKYKEKGFGPYHYFSSDFVTGHPLSLFVYFYYGGVYSDTCNSTPNSSYVRCVRTIQ